jgi:putative ABC transport system substrate-binding protein
MLSDDGGLYREFADALRRNLSSEDVTLAVVNTSRPIAPASGLLIAVGTRAAEAAAAGNASAILNVLIPQAEHEKLLRDFPRRADSHSYSSIFLDQPLGRQVALIAAALPGLHRVGVLYSNPPTMELAQLRQKMMARHMDLHTQVVSSDHPLSAALSELLESSEILLALADSNVYNSSTIRNILLAAYRNAVPMVGISTGYVRAGALCAVYSTPTQIAAQAAAMIRQFRETHVLPAAQYPRDFEVSVNEQVARSLELPLKSPGELQEEIKTSERNMQ